MIAQLSADRARPARTTSSNKTSFPLVAAAAALLYTSSAIAQSDSCQTPTVITGIGSFPFNTAGATTSYPGTPGECFPTVPGGFGPATIQNDLWFLWVNDTCTDFLVDVYTCGGPADDTMVALYYNHTSCPGGTDHARCCNEVIQTGPLTCPAGGPRSLVNCETQCCDLVLIQVGLDSGAAPVNGHLVITCQNPVGCGRPQGCCMPDGSCHSIPADCCTNLGGTSLGLGVFCEGDANNDGKDDACCDVPGGASMSIDLATGWDDIAGAVFPVNGNDDTWTVTAGPFFIGPVPHPAVALTPNVAWCPPMTNSRWVGPIAGTQGGANYAGNFVFRTCFCLANEFQNVELNFDLRADNGASVHLVHPALATSTLLATAPVSSFSCPTLTSFATNNQALFHPGENCLEVRLANTSGPTGFNLIGSLTAENARCCCEPLPDGSGCQAQACGNAQHVCRPVETVSHGGNVVVTRCDCLRRQCIDDCGDLRLCNGTEACLESEECATGEPPCGDSLLCDEAELICRPFDLKLASLAVHCLTGPETSCDGGCEMFDVEFDADCDLADQAKLERLLAE